MPQREIVVVGAARTAIGSYGGALKDVPMRTLATTVVQAALERSRVAPPDVGHVVFGNVIPTEPADAYLSRISAIDAGIPRETPAFNVNRLCRSGLQSILSAAQTIAMGGADIAIGGGAESMSRGPYLAPSLRWGAMGDASCIDYMNGSLHDSWNRVHMGITAENVAERYGISRSMQDALAAESQRRGAGAIEEGRFDTQIVPIKIPGRKGIVRFDRDEHVRPEVDLANAKMSMIPFDEIAVEEAVRHRTTTTWARPARPSRPSSI
nr:hypothetical protein [Aromatoleum toluclasticum]